MIGSTNAMGGSGVTSDETTVTKDKVLAGSTYLGADTNDETGIGTMPNRGSWTSSVPMNGSVTIPDGAHKNSKVNGPSVTQRGAPSYTLPINGIQNLAEGYYTGGKVTQTIATMGGQTITPGTSVQTVNSIGKYMTGNVIVNSVTPPPAGKLAYGYTYMGVTGTMRELIIESPLLVWKGANTAINGFIKNPIKAASGSVSGNINYTYGSSYFTSEIRARGDGGTGSNWGEVLFRLSDGVNLTGYNTVRILISSTTKQSGNIGGTIALGFNSSGSITNGSFQVNCSISQNISNAYYTIDVSSLNGYYYMYSYQYIPYLSGSRQNYTNTMTLSEIWLL